VITCIPTVVAGSVLVVEPGTSEKVPDIFVEAVLKKDN
jgi:hypothetical protein